MATGQTLARDDESIAAIMAQHHCAAPSATTQPRSRAPHLNLPRQMRSETRSSMVVVPSPTTSPTASYRLLTRRLCSIPMASGARLTEGPACQSLWVHGPGVPRGTQGGFCCFLFQNLFQTCKIYNLSQGDPNWVKLILLVLSCCALHVRIIKFSV